MNTAPYFDSPAAIATLRSRAAAWVGTPFFPHSRAKGPAGGVDCVNLVHAILVEAGALEARAIPNSLPMDWSDHHAESAVEAFFAGELADLFQAIEVSTAKIDEGPEILPGDVLGFRFGRCVHHIALAVTAEDFVHALRPSGVRIYSLGDESRGLNYADRLVRIWRRVKPAAVATDLQT